MSNVSLEIVMKTSGDKKHATNISYVNQTAENEKLGEFAMLLAQLTSDMYVSTTKITKEMVI